MKKFFIVYKHLTSDFNRTSEIAAMRHYDRTQVASSTILRLGASNLDAASLYIGCAAVARRLIRSHGAKIIVNRAGGTLETGR